MTTIQKDEYVFSVEVEKTQEYYKTHSICDCVCCRNYYVQIKNKFPKLNAFLSEFGIDISKPDEIVSVEMDNYIDYINAVSYTHLVEAKLEKNGKAKKIRVFKYKAKKNERKRIGHRQPYSKVTVSAIKL